MDILLTRDKGKPARPIWCLSPSALNAWCESNAGSRSAWVESNQFTASKGQVLLLPDKAGGIEGVLLGIGQKTDPFIIATLPAKVPPGVYRLAEGCPQDIAEQAALAWMLGTYRFTRYLSKSKTPTWPQLVIASDFDLDGLKHICEAVFLARDLINTPAEDMGPEAIEVAVQALAQSHKAELTTLTGDDLCAHNYNLIHAVGRAARQAPRLIDLTWGPADAPEICLIGKGVCFDSGGLNIKTGNYMDLMKKDMGGAAIAIGLAKAIMSAHLPVRLRLLIGAVENAIGPEAFRPGDIFTSRNGMTVEIGNTDAEGRLVLADLLATATAGTPDIILDFATLTGAARVALGPDIMPFYTRHESLAGELMVHAQQTNDPLWHMPLWEGYDSWLDSSIADVSHIASSPMAGSVIAALFLARFVPAEIEWAHFDVYGWTPKALPGRPVGGEANALRATFSYLKTRYSPHPDE